MLDFVCYRSSKQTIVYAVVYGSNVLTPLNATWQSLLKSIHDVACLLFVRYDHSSCNSKNSGSGDGCHFAEEKNGIHATRPC